MFVILPYNRNKSFVSVYTMYVSTAVMGAITSTNLINN